MFYSVLFIYQAIFLANGLMDINQISTRFSQNSDILNNVITNISDFSIKESSVDSTNLQQFFCIELLRFCTSGNLLYTENEDQLQYFMDYNFTDWYLEEKFGTESYYHTMLLGKIFFMAATNISTPFFMVSSNQNINSYSYNQTESRNNFNVFVQTTTYSSLTQLQIIFVPHNFNLTFEFIQQQGNCSMNQIKIKGLNDGDSIFYFFFTVKYDYLPDKELQNFIDSTIKLLQNCSLLCDICSVDYGCLKCRTSINMVIYKGECVCVSGYFLQYDQCVQCYSRCQNCINYENKCTSCNKFQNRKLEDQSCLCQQGYFEIGQDVCQKCVSTCQRCENYDSLCLSCYDIQFRELVNENCICQQGYFEILSQSQCQQCQFNCQQCQYNSTFCTECFSSQNRVLINNNCVCSDGFNEVDGTCILELSADLLCPIATKISLCRDQKCKVCYDPNVCTQCEDYYFLQSQSCVKCPDECLSCNNSKTCIICKLGINNITGLCLKCQETNMTYLKGSCQPVCGDGMINLKSEQCDDFNQQDGDGQFQHFYFQRCSKECQIEKPRVTLGTYFDPNQNKPYVASRILYVNYSIEIPSINHTFNISDKTLNNSIYLENYEFQQNSGRQYILTFTLSESSVNKILVISSKISDQYALKYNLTMVLIPDYIKPSTSEIIVAKGTQVSTSVLLIVILVLCLLSIFFGGFKMVFDLLELLQNFSYFYFVNIKMPFMVDQVFRYLSAFNLNFLIIQFLQQFNLMDYFDVQSNNIPFKFAQQGYQSLFIISLIGFTFQIWLSIQTYLIFLCYKYIFKSFEKLKSTWIGEFIFKISQKVCYNFFFNQLGEIIFSISIDLNICAFLEILNFSFTKSKLILYFSQYIAILCVVFQTLFLLKVRKFMQKKKNWAFSTKFSKNVQFLTENIRMENRQNRLFTIFNLINDIIFTAALVLLYQTPMLQTTVLFLNSLAKLLRNWSLQNFENKFDNLRYFALTSTTSLSYFIFLVLAIDQQYSENTLISQQWETAFAYILQVLWVTVISTYCITDTYENLQVYKLFLNQFKKKITIAPRNRPQFSHEPLNFEEALAS